MGGSGLQASFTRYRYELPTLAVFFMLALLELLAVHLLLSIWSPVAAWVLSGLTVLMLFQMSLLVHGMVKWPTVVDDTKIIVRHGRRGDVIVPLAQVVSIEDVSFRPEEKGPQAFRATVLAQPNIRIRLSEPLHRGRRTLSSISIRLDDPASFISVVSARLAGEGAGGRPDRQETTGRLSPVINARLR